MLKKSLVLMGISAAFFAQAQDISVIRNTAEVYSGNPIVGSAKFNAMAGANGALGGDANSLLTNPAGLGVAISGEVSGTLSITGNKNSSSRAGATITNTQTGGDLGNAGGIIAFPLMTESAWKFINIGVNFSNQSLDNVVESPGNANLIAGLPDGQASLAGHGYSRYGNLSKMSFGVGANYNHSVYIGAGLNFFNSSINQGDRLAFQMLNNNYIDFFDKQDSPYYERSSGFSASLGVIGKLSPNFRVGASIETPTFWNIDRDYSFYNDPDYGNGTGIESRKFNSPLKATVSAAFVANKNFSLNVDYTLGLTKPDYKVNTTLERELNDFFKENYKNQSEVRVGAEYRVQQFRVRGGYSYLSNPLDALTITRFDDGASVGNQSYNNLILSDRNLVSFGVGYDFKSFFIDASYQNVSSKYSNPYMRGMIGDYFDSAYYSTQSNSIFENDAYAVSNVKNSINNFFITVGWKF
ncbi:OmpP1/FadL family transporter [Chryseobacterium pennipullorum]|uniref:Hemin receptor n=1 Tax=Chryseobacterium pennipullorum TaxID=2258963 RepID=A0A3D9B296_9FLAO|nr:hemin receptor [Chryseobacterium pennipullorum]REC47751.1 hemin receptor [Chryseobacterium pennipullorum]